MESTRPAVRVAAGHGDARYEPYRPYEPRGRCERSPWTELRLGPVWMSQVSPPAPLPVRLGPRTWRLALALGGPLALRRDEGGTRLRQGELALWEPARPGRAAPVPGGHGCRAVIVHLPGSALPVPDRALEYLASLPLSCDSGPGALLANFVGTLAEQAAAPLAPPQASRLGTAVVHLCAAFLTGLAQDVPLPAPSPGEALRSAVKAYIDAHLGDADLSPAAVAAAHHISVRYLHHLFRGDGLTVGGYVRRQRLERCRADLASAHLAGLSVARIRSRWGFPDAAVFGRAFKSAYGLPPGEYRRRAM